MKLNKILDVGLDWYILSTQKDDIHEHSEKIIDVTEATDR